MDQVIAREPSRGHAKLEVSSLPFSAIPHQTRLFTEYLRDPASLNRFYPNAVALPASVSAFAPQVISNYRTDRRELADALTEINSKVTMSEATFNNISLLGEPDTVAVVTGQQAGLFTGPLYTIYKALSAIKMAEVLCTGGTKAVPVFWAATEDHDFAEVSEAFFIDKSGAPARFEYEPAGYVKDAAVGSVRLDDRVHLVIDEIFRGLPDTEFSDEVRHLLSASWTSGTGFGDAFMGMLASLLGKFGLVFIDPMNARIKKLSAPVYAAAARAADEIATNVLGRSRDLEAEGFHAQVAVEGDYFPLFWHDDEGRRTALRKLRDGVYLAKGTKREFAISELEQIAGEEPHSLSPGVLLRPVVQDHLLPTVCYFGGAAEIAYFAQISEVYRRLGRPVTPVFHRQSFTIVEARSRRALERYDLDLPGLFKGIDETMLLLSEKSLAPDLAKLFAEVEEKINTELNRLDQDLSHLDQTLAANLAKRRRKIIYHIVALRKKALLTRARQDETVSRQISGLFTALLPNGQLQERSINVVTYLNKFGLNFIDWIYEAIDLEDKDHRIIDL